MADVIKKADRLIDNGYQVIPVDGDGIPSIAGFNGSDVYYSRVDAKDWVTTYHGAGIALVAGKEGVYALDFDVDDKEVAVKLRKAIKKKWPKLPIRKCNPPRFAVVFKAKKKLLKVSGGRSNGYTSKNHYVKKKNSKGKRKKKYVTSRIELIGNQPITMYGEHRKTGRAYSWDGKYSPTNQRVSELPELNLKDVQAIFKMFDSLMNAKDEWLIKDQGRIGTRNDGGGTTFENSQSYKRFTDEEVLEILEVADNDCGRDDWRDVGFALHHNYNGSQHALDMWDDWSKRDNPASYDGIQHLKQQWGSFGGTSKPITMQTIAKRVRKQKKKKPKVEKKRKEKVEKLAEIDARIKRDEQTLEQWLKQFVYVTKNKLVADTHVRPAIRSMLTFDEFKNKFIGIREDTLDEDNLTNAKLLADMWASHSERIVCDDTEYWPCDDKVMRGEVVDSNLTFYNIYDKPFYPETKDDDKLKYFLNHIDHVFYGEGDANWMINWMAQTVQQPDSRFTVTPLSICINEGVGRGWIVKLLKKMYGGQNCSTIKAIEQITNPDGKNDYMYRKVFCSVAETRARGKEQYAVNSILRNILDADELNVDVKYGFKGEAPIFTRFFLQSNHIDGLIFDESDRRVEAFINRRQPKPKDYYTKLHAMLKDVEFLGQVYWYLANFKVDESLLQRPRDTEARREIIQAGLSKTSLAFYQFKELVGQDWFFDKHISAFMRQWFSIKNRDDMTSANMKEVSYLIKKEAQSTQTISGGKTLYNFKYIENPPKRKLLSKSVELTKRKLTNYFNKQEQTK